MATRPKDDEAPLGPDEMHALRRLAEPQAPSLPEPDQLWASRYRILESIGHGAMGDVFLARDVLLDRLVALKVLRNTSEERFVDEHRLLREARAAARVEHECIARVYDAGTWNGSAFIASEYVHGVTLRVWMSTHRATMSEIIIIVQQLLEGLQALHQRGLLHRNLKPENVTVTPEGSLRILDLGVARRVPLADTVEGVDDSTGNVTLRFGVGTPGYMAPEQWRSGDCDARTDLFALGVIAYELVVGRAPFRGATNREIREHTLHSTLSFEATEWSEVPPVLKATISKALAHVPAERFQDAGAMADALASLMPTDGTKRTTVGSIRANTVTQGSPTISTGMSSPDRGVNALRNAKVPRRKPLAYVALLGAAGFGIMLMLWQAASRSPASSPPPIVDSYDPRVLVFHPAERMKIYARSNVTAAIGSSVKEIERQLRSGRDLSAEIIDVPPRVGASLRGEGFKVTPENEVIQDTSRTEQSAIWSWSVTPDKAGRRSLELTLCMHRLLGSNDTQTCADPITRYVDVSVDGLYDRLKYYRAEYELLFTTGILTAAGGSLVYLLKFFWRRWFRQNSTISTSATTPEAPPRT